MSSYESDNSSQPGPSTSKRKRPAGNPRGSRRKLNERDDWMEVIEEEEESSKTYIKPELIARAVDVIPTSLHVFASLYQQNGTCIVSLPILPEISPVINYNDPPDYRDYNGRLSSMFAVHGKKTRKDARPPPCPPLEYKCKQCAWSFVTPSALARHVDTHYDMGVYVCQACLTIFNHSMNIYEHWRYNCPPTVHDYTMPAKDLPVHRLRHSVFAAICTANHTNMFNMFDGVMFIPSEQFLANPNNIIIQQHIRTCHFCALDVPNKFLECHGDVHRGRFRIDKPIYGHYFCHLCAMVFRYKENLIFHWRSKCSEVVVHTPDEYVLDDDELAALAFLVLQQTVPHKKIASMMDYSMFFLKKMKREHAKKNHLLAGVTSTYYYFPQEIWPMQTYAGYDLILDSFPLSNDLTFAELAGRVHNCNLLATACPDFYATGMEFNEIRVPREDGNTEDALLRTVLRFTTHGSVIKTYKINGRSLPRLRPRCVIDGTRSKEYNTDSQVDECSSCKDEKMTSCASTFRLNKHLKGLRHKNMDISSHNCPVCNVVCIYSKEEHWQMNCRAIRMFVKQNDWEYVDEKFVLQLADMMKKHAAKPTLKGKNIVEISGSQNAFRKIREQVVKDIEKAKSRDRHLKASVGTAREPENEQMVTICPHCGGKYHADGLLAHMESRHGYGDDADELYEAVKTWKRSGCKNSYETFKTTVDTLERAGKPVAPIMTEEQYENVVRYVFCTDGTMKFTESPWIAEETSREIKITSPLLLLSEQPNNERIVRSEADPAFDPYFPEVTEDESKLASNAMPNQWIRLSRRARRVDNDVPIDPYTGRPYPEHLAAIVRAESEKFFGNSKDELKKIGLDVNFLTDFFISQPGEEYDEYGVDSEPEEDDDSDKDDLDDSNFDLSDDEENDEEDEEEDGDSDGVIDSREIARINERRKRDVAEALKQQKEDAKHPVSTGEYNPAHFAPLPQAIHPRHRNMEKYLTPCIVTTSEDRVVDTSEPYALNLMIENKLTVVHDNCRRFREMYLQKFPYGETNQNYIPKKLANKRFTMMEYTAFEDKLQLIVDESNYCFIGGLVLPKDFQVEPLHYFYISLEDPPVPPEQEVMVIRLRVYSARDEVGDFKFAWPARNEQIMNDKYFKEKGNKEQSKQPNHDYALRLTRVETIKNKEIKFARVISVPQRLFDSQSGGKVVTKEGQDALMNVLSGKAKRSKAKKARAARKRPRPSASRNEPSIEEEHEDDAMEH